jgi:hypothetical protein
MSAEEHPIREQESAMSSRIRFTTARQVFDTFATAATDIATQPTDEAPLIFIRKLALSDRPIDAIAFCAYLLPRREAVWWACQCVRAIQGEAVGEDAAMKAAEAWVRDPEESMQRAALGLGASGNVRAATTWLAKAAGWSGGSIAPPGLAPVPPPPHLTAKAALAAIVLAMAKAGTRSQAGWIEACTEACIRFADGGDAKPRLLPR